MIKVTTEGDKAIIKRIRRADVYGDTVDIEFVDGSGVAYQKGRCHYTYTDCQGYMKLQWRGSVKVAAQEVLFYLTVENYLRSQEKMGQDNWEDCLL